MSEERFFIKKWILLFSVIGMISGFLLLSSEIQEARQGQTESITKVDDQVRLDFIGIRNVTLNTMASDVTALGSVTVLGFLVSILCLLFLNLKRAGDAVQLLCAALGASLLIEILKMVLRVPRPDEINRLVHATGYSFPSGHTLSAASIYLTIAILVARDFKNSSKKIAIGGIFIILILAVALSRVYLGVHYMSDVLGGILIGTSWALILSQASKFFHGLGQRIERI